MKITLKSLSLLLSALLAVSVSYSCRKSSDAEPVAEADVTPLTVTGCIGGADTKVTYTVGTTTISQKWAVGDTIIGIDNASNPKTYTYVVTKVSNDTASFKLANDGKNSRYGTATDNPSYGTTMYMIYAPGYAAKDFNSGGILSIDISKQDTTNVGNSASGLHIPGIMTATGTVNIDNKLELTFANRLELLMIEKPTLSGRTTETTITSFTVSGSESLPTTATFSASGFKVGSDKGTVTKNCSLKTTASGTTSGTVLIALLPASTQNLIIKSSNSYTDTIKSHTPTASRLLSVSGATFSAVMTGVTISKTSTTITAGSTETLKYTVEPEGAAVTSAVWSSSKSSVATVDESTGVVTGVAKGTAYIYLTVNGTFKDTCTVTVNPPAVTGVSITTASPTIDKGSTVQLSYSVTPADAEYTPAWSSSDTDVATVDTEGVVTGKSAGEATITVTVTDKYHSSITRTATCTVTVNPPAVTSVSITPTSASIYVGASKTLTYTVQPTGAEGSAVWTSSNESVATVTDGVVTGEAAGNAGITVKFTDMYGNTASATCTVTVTKPIIAFSVSASKKVKFTNGNLYWDGSAFHIEKNQTDYYSSWNAKHVGHFFWTSLTDYQSSNTSYMPYASSYSYSAKTASDKFWCGEDNKLTVDGKDSLYALSIDEWTYLIQSRTNASSLYKYGVTVTNGGTNYTNCLIIAPDGFTGTLSSSYSLDQVNALGLVCLPAAGYRTGTNISYYDSQGICWSSTLFNMYAGNAHRLFFGSANVVFNAYSRMYGSAVRLVYTAN